MENSKADLLAITRFRNLRLYEELRLDARRRVDVCKEIGISYNSLVSLLSLKRSPFRKRTDKYTETAIKIACFFLAAVADAADEV